MINAKILEFISDTEIAFIGVTETVSCMVIRLHTVHHLQGIHHLIAFWFYEVIMELRNSIFAKRPGLGSEGRTTRVRTNYFEITVLPFPEIYHYNINIIPEVPPAVNRKICKRLEDIHSKSGLGRIKFVYDGRKNLYTAEPFPFGKVATFKVTLPEDDFFSAFKRFPRHFRVKIKKVGEIDMEEINGFLDGKYQMSNNVLTG
jgi:eukaryotic translation initiation factor 2C